MQHLKILVLRPSASGRSALEETLVRLGHVVLATGARPDGRPPACGDVVMLDVRGGGDCDWPRHVEGLMADARPLMIVSDRPRPLVRTLSSRPAPTMVMTGAESDAGHRVALEVLAALGAARPLGAGREPLARIAAP